MKWENKMCASRSQFVTELMSGRERERERERQTDRQRCELGRKKEPFLFNFCFFCLRGLISAIAQLASPSHGEGVVCFCGQTASFRAGGRAKGRVGLFKRMLRKSGAGVDALKANSSAECRQKTHSQCSHAFEEKCFLMSSALHDV